MNNGETLLKKKCNPFQAVLNNSNGFCKRCSYPTNFMDTKIESDGVCSLCHEYDKYKDLLENYDYLQELFQKKIGLMKKERQEKNLNYDAVVAISGGTDSSYVLWDLVKNHTINPLAFTYERGFYTCCALQNRDTVLKALNVDLIIKAVDQNWILEIRKNFLLQQEEFCKIGSKLLHALLFDVTANYSGLPIVIYGFSRGQMMFTMEGFSVVLETLQNVINPSKEQLYKWANNIWLQPNVLRDIAKTPWQKKLAEKYIYDLNSSENTPHIIPYFLFHPLAKNNIVNTIQEKLNWQKPADYKMEFQHTDCEFEIVADYIYPYTKASKVGEPKKYVELAYAVRTGQMDLHQAAEIADIYLQKERPNKQIDKLLTLLKLDSKDIPWMPS